MLYGQPEAIFRINAMLVADGVFSLSVACRVVGRLVGGAKQFLEIHAKKAGRDRHHHGRALHRRSMGQGE